MRALTATVGVSVCLLAEESPRCPTGRASWCWTQLEEHRHPVSATHEARERAVVVALDAHSNYFCSCALDDSRPLSLW